jgi:membrane protease YdiL (CAAX protease family)
MKPFFEPLILFWVLFFRIPAWIAAPGEAGAFSEIDTMFRIIMYILPSLALVWYLQIKARGLADWSLGLKELGIGFPKKRDIGVAVLAFPALTFVGATISLVSPHFAELPVGPKFLPPDSGIAWAILVLSCFSTAYLEESYFRFYLLSKREEMGLGQHRAVLVSTLLFAFCHVYEGPWGFLNAALSGVLLAFIFLRFRSLHGISIAHAMYNILVYSLGAVWE